MQRGSIIFLKAAVIFMGLAVLMLCLLWLPKTANNAAETNPELAYLRLPVLLGLYATTIPFFLALYHSIRLLSLFEHETAFSREAIIPMKKIRDSALVIAALYVGGMFFLGVQNALHPGIALLGLMIAIISVLIGLFAVILKALFAKGLTIQSENELVI